MKKKKKQFRQWWMKVRLPIVVESSNQFRQGKLKMPVERALICKAKKLTKVTSETYPVLLPLKVVDHGKMLSKRRQIVASTPSSLMTLRLGRVLIAQLTIKLIQQLVKGICIQSVYRSDQKTQSRHDGGGRCISMQNNRHTTVFPLKSI